MDFKEKIVVITGGTCGIGLSIVKKLLTTEIKVIALFELVTPNSAKVFFELEEIHGNRVEFYSCDVTNTLKLKGNFDKVHEKYKTIDILINNAGIINENALERMIDINYKAVVLSSLMMIERVGKHKGGKGGVIINLASILGLADLFLPIYCSTKHAVVSFTRTMKQHYDKTGVRVIAICPGATNTGMLNDIPKGLDFIDTSGALQLFPSSQSPENVANGLVDVVFDQGRSGDVWVIEEDQPPYIMNIVDHWKRIIKRLACVSPPPPDFSVPGSPGGPRHGKWKFHQFRLVTGLSVQFSGRQRDRASERANETRRLFGSSEFSRWRALVPVAALFLRRAAMEVKDKVVIVTGGTGGIGFAAVQALLRHEAKYVAIFDLDSMHTRAAACVKKIEQEFGTFKADFYTCDVTITSEFAARYDEIVGMQGSVDILVNYANIVDERRAHHMIDTNLTGTINCTLIGIDRMGRHHNGKGGAIVNVCSIFGLRTAAAFPIYTASKFGVYGFTKAMKDHYQHLGVRVMAICPGITETSLLHQNIKEDVLNIIPDKFIDEAFQCSKYIQQPENVGKAIVQMIEEAESGAVWVSEDNEPPYSVKDPVLYKDRAVPVGSMSST
ncbi:uncharacterized protein LOC131665051 [Phymastichus coffea]|uniref:uncharacterized protein LOC131665051 n=1 Tax=Phymastichus coffea TaxID=108790 RepID=UPI00273B6879|nr:uncharacterized protein LOC131665051 [Phymastichus coffea]